jgi:hypothetical protein
MTDSLWLYDLSATVGTDAPLFKLDVSEIGGDDAKSNEPMEIPGTPWNIWFDNENVQAKLTFTGKFISTDSDWNSTTFSGRPFDFIRQLRSILHGLDAAAGTVKPDGTKYNGFKIVLHQVYNGVEKTYDLYAQYTTPIIYLFDKFTWKVEGGVVSAVSYTISFVEAGSVINFGRA